MEIDLELIRGSQKGDPVQQEALYKSLYPWMLHLAFNYTQDRDLAVDLMNQGFYKLITKLSVYREETPFYSWAKVVVKNAIIDEVRKNQRYSSRVDRVAEPHLTEETVENCSVLKLENDWVDALIDRLPRVTALVIRMQVLEGYTHREIASLLKISESASKWHLSKGKSLLRPLLTTE